MIRVKGLKKSFGDQEVLKGIDVDFEQGKTNLIIGRSGSGKTVFVKCLIGLLVPEEGEIYFAEKNMLRMGRKEMQGFRSSMGTVFQGSALFDSMTVMENVRFPLDMFWKESNKTKSDRVMEVLERVDLEHAVTKYPAELSGGMQKRVAIARAIVHKPKYLFADEPNSGLDPHTAILIDRLLQELTREYNTVTVVNTHDMNSVLEIGQKILFLKDGYKEWEGNNEEILVTNNQNITDFVYSSDLFKKLRAALIKEQ